MTIATIIAIPIGEVIEVANPVNGLGFDSIFVTFVGIVVVVVEVDEIVLVVII
jgi:hypothetical protein